MKNRKQFWVTVALVNLCLVALLGVTLRSKILFPLPGIDFKHVLHAHSHFAFGGWITMALMSLMIYEILPTRFNEKRHYQWYLWGILIAAMGMLVSFLCQGYAFFSILFSTLFIFVTYVFSYVFIRDLKKSRANAGVTVLSVFALIFLTISSVGPFTLAYLMATHSNNNFLYRDSIYTYLHFQYNGFFTLAVFALFFNALQKSFVAKQLKKASQFAWVISVSVIPTLFISYLWHFPTTGVKVIAIIGCISVAITIFFLIRVLISIKNNFSSVPLFARNIASLSIFAFLLKSLLQTGTVIPSLAKLVFGDRAIIVGYLHLVLLGFITLYLLAHLLHSGALNASKIFTRIAIVTFAGSVMANEAILMVQGFGNMLMVSNSIYTWLLWGASIGLFSGALLILISRLTQHRNNVEFSGELSPGNISFLYTN